MTIASFKPKQNKLKIITVTVIMIAYWPLNSGPKYVAKMIAEIEEEMIENTLDAKIKNDL